MTIEAKQALVFEGMELPDRKPAPEGRLTWEQFLEWAGESDKAEWVDGEVILLMPEGKPHQRLVVFLVTLFQVYASRYDLGEIFTSYLVRIVTRPSGRAPDVAFLRREQLDRLRDTYIDGPVDLAVELISPSSHQRDLVDKMAEYAGAPVPEYWTIDAETREPAFYQLGPDGAYQRVLPDADGIYRSAALPGFWLRVAWLQEDPPPQIAALKELGLL